MKNFIETEKERLAKLEMVLELIEYAEIRIKNRTNFWQDQIFKSEKSLKRIEFTKMAKERLENYYKKILQA